MEIKSYRSMRYMIEDGDVLMFRGKGVFSWLIKKITKSEYSHAGIMVWWNKRLMVVEAIGKGVVVKPLSKVIGEYNGDVVLLKCSEEMFWSVTRAIIVNYTQLELGKEYSIWKVIVFGWKKLWGMSLEGKDKYVRSEKLICSHFVAAAYNYAGRDLKKGVSDSFTSPDDIVKSPIMDEICILKQKN